MTDLRRSVLWGVFIVSLVMLWDGWQKHQGHPSMFSPAPVPTAPAPSSAPGAAPAAGAAVPVVASAGAAVAGPAVRRGEEVVITTDVVRATLDTQGGSLVRLELLQQHEPVVKAWYQPWLELFTGSAANAEPPRPVVLFDRSAARVYLARSGLAQVAGTVYPNHESVLRLVSSGRELAAGQNELVLRFESDEVAGVQWVKTYTFRRGDYAIGVRHEVVNRGSAPFSPVLYAELVRDGTPPPGGSSFYATFTGPAVYTQEKNYQKVDFSAIDKRGPKDDPGHVTAANNGWIAMVQHYFASAWLFADGANRQYSTARLSDGHYAATVMLPLAAVAPGASGTVDATLFAGPQEETRLAALAPGLEHVKDYGMFTILAKPLFWLLTRLHNVLGNWGWSIVGLVVLLKIAFYWLNASAYRSMAKMKAVNPRLMELRERFKDEPQKMQQEMMRIYREEKVNPMGSCLPILVQMPFFFSLYWVLLSSVEMRNAPWIGWIHDLSAFDPYFVLPLLMTASTMFQTWLNPTPADPVQARLMWIMPLVFSAMFFVFPAGLVLYWLTNNLLSIAQQWFINKRLGVA